MRVVCAGCGADLGEKPSDSLGEDAISHGICEPCAVRFLAQIGVPIDEYLESLAVPTVLVTQEGAVNSANSQALTLLGKELAHIQGQPGGNVFECAYAELPEGCGHTVHCSGCTIRNTVTDTWETGEPRVRVPAYLQQSSGAGAEKKPVRLELLISTEKRGGVVFLSIEEIGPAKEPAKT